MVGLLAITYSLYISTSRSGKIAVEFDFMPDDAEVLIDNSVAKNRAVKYLEPGEYSVTASREGFADYDDVYFVNENNNVILISLAPQSETAFDYIAENEELYLEFEDRGGEIAVQEGIRFSEVNPITRDLPYSTFFFTIGYRLDQSDPNQDSIIIEIDAEEGYKNTALQHLRNLGYNPTEYNINFRNHRNPFDE